MDSISRATEAARIKLPSIECRYDEPMKNHTSFRIGGPLRAMFIPRNAEELIGLCKLLRGCGIVPLIIGNGTNLLVGDSRPLEMVAIKTTGIDHAERTGKNEITAGAGISLSKLATFACECGLSGLECAHGIPGSLGGAVAMNAGAYGMEMKDVIYSTDGYGNGTGIYTLTAEEHDFSYRRSRFSDTGDIVVSSVIRLRKGDRENIREKMDELFEDRSKNQPLELPSAGSAFKRPKDGYAASLIENAGLKGFSVGGAQVSKKHAGFIVNTGGASFSDVMAVIEYVRETVFRQTGVDLEPEIRIVNCG